MPEAATSRPVWLTIYGTRGSIINKYLEIAENQLFPFEPDNSDLFVLYDLDIGEVNLSRSRSIFSRKKNIVDWLLGR